MKIDVMGVAFDNITMDEAVASARMLLAGEQAACCVTPNSEIVYEAMRDPALCALLNRAQLVLPDGAGVVLASRILGTPLKEKVAGVDFAARLLTLLEESGGRLYLLGGTPGIAELAAEKMRQAHPGLCICGTADGYFTDADEAVARINEAGADVLFVCLGAPKQERFMDQYRDRLSVKLMAGLGGSLDAFAGTAKRAPRWMIRMNLEWFYRLCRQPRRLGRMMRLPKFLLAVLGKKIKR